MPKKAQNQGLYRKKNENGEYIGMWYLPIWVDGKKHVRSTETEDLTEAKAKIPYVISKLMKDLGGDQNRTNRFDWNMMRLFENFIEDRRMKDFSVSSMKGYGTLKKHIFDFFGPNFKINDLKQESIRQFIIKKQDDGLKRSTIFQLMITFRAMLRFAISMGAWSGNPDVLISQELIGTKHSIITRFLTPNEFQRLIEAVRKSKVPHIEDYFMMYIFLGLRRRELFRVLQRDIDLEQKRILIRGTKTKQSVKAMPIPDLLIPIIQKRIEGKMADEEIFPEIKNIHMNIKLISKRAGLPHCTIRDLRRTTGSILASNGANLSTIQQVLRHSNINTTARHYAHLMPEVVPSALNMLGEIMNG